ncbi:MAG: hypothetical protein R3A10_10210 [Caldilineaceae bacterium]
MAFDDRILTNTPRSCAAQVRFADHDIMEIVDFLAHMGLAVVATPLAVLLPDGDDLPFGSCVRSVGHSGHRNLRHFPEALCSPVTVMAPAALLDQLPSSSGHTPG